MRDSAVRCWSIRTNPRTTDDVLTPSAARGILEAIYWKPEMRWVIDRIHVLAPIRYAQVRRNELSGTIPIKGKTGVATAMKVGRGHLGVEIEDHRQQRAAILLRDVCYGIEAHVHVVHPGRDAGRNHKPEAKHLDMFRRRAVRGQYFHHPYLGCREFPASFELVEDFPACPPSFREREVDLGLVLHDLVYVPDPKGSIRDGHSGVRMRAEPQFFRAVLRDGILTVPRLPTPEEVVS